MLFRAQFWTCSVWLQCVGSKGPVQRPNTVCNDDLKSWVIDLKLVQLCSYLLRDTVSYQANKLSTQFFPSLNHALAFQIGNHQFEWVSIDHRIITIPAAVGHAIRIARRGFTFEMLLHMWKLIKCNTVVCSTKCI